MSDADLDPESVRYLLGEMAAGERDEFEERFLADDDQQVLVTATEGELFVAYAEDELPHVRRRRFEATFLQGDAGANRLETTRALRQAAREERQSPRRRTSGSVSAQLSAVHRAAGPRWFAVGAMAAVIVIALAVVAC